MRVNKDITAGALFIGIGAAALAVASGYSLGTLALIGPGFYPALLSILLIVLGLIVAGRGFAVSESRPISFALRPLSFVLLAILLFGAVLRPGGLVVATLLVIVVGGVGGWQFRLKESLVLAAVMSIIVSAVFVYGLGMRIPLWPT